MQDYKSQPNMHKKGVLNCLYYGGDNMKKLFSIILAAAVLAGCSKGGPSLDDISQVKDELTDHSFSSYDNLTFDCKPAPIETDEVYIITMKSRQWKSSDESTKSELKKYVDSIYSTDIDTGKMRFDFALTQQELESGEIDSSIERFNVNAVYDDVITAELYAANNTFSASDFHDYSYGGDSFPTLKAVYTASDLPKDEFEMLDGSRLTLDEAVREANEYIKKIEPLFNEGSSYRLKKVVAENCYDKGAVIDLRFEHVFFGLAVNDSGFDLVDDEASFAHAPYIEVKLLGRNYLGKINNSHYDIIDKKEKVDKILPLSQAEKLASEKLAKNIRGTVKNVELKYVCVTNQGEDTHVYRPMWCFTLDEYEPDFRTMTLSPQRTVFVDAVNSDVYYSDALSRVFAAGQRYKGG